MWNCLFVFRLNLAKKVGMTDWLWILKKITVKQICKPKHLKLSSFIPSFVLSLVRSFIQTVGIKSHYTTRTHGSDPVFSQGHFFEFQCINFNWNFLGIFKKYIVRLFSRITKFPNYFKMRSHHNGVNRKVDNRWSVNKLGWGKDACNSNNFLACQSFSFNHLQR